MVKQKLKEKCHTKHSKNAPNTKELNIMWVISVKRANEISIFSYQTMSLEHICMVFKNTTNATFAPSVHEKKKEKKACIHSLRCKGIEVLCNLYTTHFVFGNGVNCIILVKLG